MKCSFTPDGSQNPNDSSGKDRLPFNLPLIYILPRYSDRTEAGLFYIVILIQNSFRTVLNAAL